MKYKLIGTVAVLVMLLVTLTAQIYQDPKEHRFVQHRDATPKAACTDHPRGALCTHLPLLQITTDGREAIPGKMVHPEGSYRFVPATTASGEDTIGARLTVTDNPERMNHLLDTPQIESRAILHVRGNSSRHFDKLNYAIRLVNADGSNNPLPVMGMDAHHEWALHGPILDKTLIRNYMWYNLAGELMDYAPNVRFCEMILNGEYMGLYVMMETITGGKNGVRLPLSVDKKKMSFSGYLLRMDRGSQNAIKNINTFSMYSYRGGSVLDIVYPGAANLNETMRRKIERDFSDFEKILYSYDIDEKNGYKALIDVNDFVLYFLINSFTSNGDAGWLSTYIYKGLDDRFRLCVWDFNSACDNYQERAISPKGFEFQYGVCGSVWFEPLMRDEDFVDVVIAQYRKLRKTTLSDEYLFTFIDQTIAYLGAAIDRNYQKWGYTFQPEKDMLTPADRNPRSYAEAVDDMKNYIRERGAWIDQNIETLRQYSAKSRTKKFDEDAN